MPKFMEVLVETSTELFNRLYFCQLKWVTNRFIVILLQVFAGLENDSALKLLKYDAFPQVMAPINALYSNHASKIGFMWHFETVYSIMLASKKKYKEHLVKAKLERNYYNKKTKLAEQQRKLVNEHFIARGKAGYCSVDATAHYSYDWAQNVHVPHSDQQVRFIILVRVKCIYLVYKMKQCANKLIMFSIKPKLSAKSYWYAEHGIR